MKERKTKKIILWTAVAGLLVFFHFLGILSPVESVIFRAANPLLKKVYSLASFISAVYGQQVGQVDLLSEFRNLEERNNSLMVENSRLKDLEKENEILRQYLKFPKERHYSYVLANVISKIDYNFSEADRNIIIDKGSKDGIDAGMILVDEHGAAVGKVVKVKSDFSEACLLVNSSCRLAAAMQNREGTAGIVGGELGLTMEMEFIPQGREINIGDVVVTSGLEENIPSGIVLGKVAGVSKESNEMWQKALIDPLVSPDYLGVVSILLPEKRL